LATILKEDGMPNIKAPSEGLDWPHDLDDLRREPSRLVFTHHLASLGIVQSYDGLKQLPPPLRMPGRMKAWEARTILLWLGASPELPLPPCRVPVQQQERAK
jgi:hypothetical protein